MKSSYSLICTCLFFAATLLCDAATNAVLGKTSLTLEESIDHALRRNAQVLKSKEEIRRRHGVVIETRGEGIPQLTGTASLTKREPQTTEFFGNPNLFNSQLRLTQVLYAGGAIWNSSKSAYLQREAAVLGFERIVADTILAVRTQFYEALFNEQLIKVREASVHLLEEQLETTKRRFEAGTVPRFDVLRAEVELANARPPLIQARNNLRIAKIKLANLLALDSTQTGPEGFPYVLIGELKYVPYDQGLAESLKIAMEERAELRELEKTMEARQRDVRVAYAGYQPRIELFGQFESRNRNLGNSKPTGFGETSDLSPDIRGSSGGVQLSWDIFDGFSTHGRVVQAKAAYAAAKLDLEDARRNIELEVREAQSRLQEARETIESQKKVVEQGEESLRLAQARFKVGAGTQLDVLSAQTALTEARTNYEEALYRYNVAVANLERATGVSTRIVDLEELRKDE